MVQLVTGLRLPGMSRRMVLVLTLAAVALGIAAFQLAGLPTRPWQGGIGVLVGWSFIGSGFVAWERRPENVIGRVMVLGGSARLAAEFCLGSPQPLLYTVGHLAHPLYLAAVAYMLLSFPEGRLDSRAARWVMMGASVAVGPLPLGSLLVSEHGDARNLLQVVSLPLAGEVIDHIQMGLGSLLAAATVVIIIRRWSQATRPFRFAAGPVLWAGAAGLVVMVLSFVDDELGGPLGGLGNILLDLFMAGVPIAFLAGLLRSRLAHSAVAELVVKLGGTTAPGELREALALALGDPSLRLAYQLSDTGRWVDVNGHPMELPGPDDDRAVTFAQKDARTIAALVHDPALGNDPQLLQSACAAAVLALENERLQAELRARLDELQESRSRMVQAAFAERRRIERNLHDGTQQRLVSVSMALALGEARLDSDPTGARGILATARGSLSTALRELRELSQGIHPGILTERGLAAALDELALSSPIPVRVEVGALSPLSETAEATAYYLVSEALANVSKHAQATRAIVRLEMAANHLLVEVQDDGLGGAGEGQGSGLRGLRDRVEALGGTLTLYSPPGNGTLLKGNIPCV